MGVILPSGLATDDTTKFFFQDLLTTNSLISFYEFENEGFFVGAGQGHMVRFALTTISAPRKATSGAEFFFQGKRIEDLGDPTKKFRLSADEILLINPNTGTAPIFSSGADAEISSSQDCFSPWHFTVTRGYQGLRSFPANQYQRCAKP